MRKLSSLLLVLAVPSQVQAACTSVGCSDVRITYIYTDGSGSNWVSTSGTEASLSCTPDSGTLIQIDQSLGKADWVYSTALSAFLTGQNVTIRTPASGTCKVVYMTAGTP
jgi:hypothetical protein